MAKDVMGRFCEYVYANVETLTADSPANYTQPFLSLQKEIIDLFEYVEPAYKNLKTYSYRIQQLLMAESISKCKFTKSFCKLLHQE